MPPKLTAWRGGEQLEHYLVMALVDCDFVASFLSIAAVHWRWPELALLDLVDDAVAGVMRRMTKRPRRNWPADERGREEH